MRKWTFTVWFQPPTAIVAQGHERVPPLAWRAILPIGMIRTMAESMRYTWLIWRALRRRPRHPLYHHSLRLAPLSATPILLVLAIVIGGAALLLPALFSALILALIGGIYLLGVYQGTVAGLLWALHIVEQGSRARTDGRFALYAAAPAGGMSAAWALATACLHNDNALEKRRGLNAECYIVAILLAIFFGARPLANYSDAEFATLSATQTQLLLSLCYFLAILALIYCNHVGAIIFGFLLGLLLPTTTHSREDARLWTVGAYGALQIGTTAAALLCALLLWPALVALPLGRTAALCLSALGSALIFYLIREIAIQRLFTAVLHQHGSDLDEWRAWLSANSDPAP